MKHQGGKAVLFLRDDSSVCAIWPIPLSATVALRRFRARSSPLLPDLRLAEDRIAPGSTRIALLGNPSPNKASEVCSGQTRKLWPVRAMYRFGPRRHCEAQSIGRFQIDDEPLSRA